MARADPVRLGPIHLALFSSPVLVVQAIELPWRVFLPAFFTITLGIDLARVAALMVAIRLIDMIADPLVGWASDRFPTRIGSRRPWMIASVPLIMLGTWQVFFAAPGIDVGTLAGWCIALHLGYTLLVVPHGGWGLEISRDYHERTRVMATKMWFAAAGLPLILLLPTAIERFTGAGRAQQIAVMGWALIGLAPASVLLVLRFIPEPPDDPATARPIVHPFRHFHRLLRDRTLVMVLLLYALVGMADAATAGTFLFFVEQALRLERIASTFILIPALTALLALPFWAAVSRHFGKRGALAAVFAWQALLAPIGLILPAGQLAPLAIFLVLRSVAWGADYMLLRAMVADIAGRDAAVTGARCAGSYYAIFNVTLKLAAALSVGVALWLLAWTGFAPGTPASASAITVIRLAYVVPSCLAGVLGLVTILLGSAAEMRDGVREHVPAL